MSTKKESSSQNTLNYDPKSLDLYHSLSGAYGKMLQGYINNPLSNPFYNLGLGQSMAGATQLGQQNINALTNNMKINGIGGNAGNAFQTAMMSNIGRGNQALRSQANLSNVFQALNRQMQAGGMALSFNPLLTGESGHSEEKTSGLGTWLPQLLGGLANGAMGAMTGGASMAGGMPSMAGMPSMSGGFGSIGSIGSLGPVMPLPPPGFGGR